MRIDLITIEGKFYSCWREIIFESLVDFPMWPSCNRNFSTKFFLRCAYVLTSWFWNKLINSPKKTKIYFNWNCVIETRKKFFFSVLFSTKQLKKYKMLIIETLEGEKVNLLHYLALLFLSSFYIVKRWIEFKIKYIFSYL